MPQVRYRQELVFKNDQLKIYNDTSATSPEATIKALERFSESSKNIILVTGGTDKNLNFSSWAKTVKKLSSPQKTIFLSGSATQKMKKELDWVEFLEYETLKECFEKAVKLAQGGSSIILFSPSSKSFEKFKNEFDRGEKFNEIVNLYASDNRGL